MRWAPRLFRSPSAALERSIRDIAAAVAAGERAGAARMAKMPNTANPNRGHSMRYTAEQIATVCHEANRELQRIHGDPAPAQPWDDAPDWQRESVIDGVTQALQGRTPEQSHEGWCARKRAEGWTYGPVKDPDARTHPCLVPYADLPPDQRDKDVLFLAIVAALTRQE